MARGETSQEDDGELLLVPIGAQYFCIHHCKFYRQRTGFQTHISSPKHPRVKSRCEKCFLGLGSKKAVERHQQGRGNHSLPFFTKWIEWDDMWMEVWRRNNIDEALVEACSAGNVAEFFKCVSREEESNASPVKLVRVMLWNMEGQAISGIVPKPGIMGN